MGPMFKASEQVRVGREDLVLRISHVEKMRIQAKETKKGVEALQAGNRRGGHPEATMASGEAAHGRQMGERAGASVVSRLGCKSTRSGVQRG